MSLPYTYESQGRSTSTAAILAAIWAALLAAVLLLDAALWIMGALALATLPALFDLITNPVSTFTLDATHLRWTSGRQDAEIALREIDHLRFDTRLDMSVRLSVMRPSGVRIKVPYLATPPSAELESVAQQAGLKTQRHHFSLMG